MPIFDLRCTGCGRVESDVFHKITEEHPPSPCCKAATESVPARIKTEPVFHGEGRVSTRLAFHPDEVMEARREIPSLDVDDDGRVYFNSRGHERTVRREIEAMQNRETANDARQLETHGARVQDAMRHAPRGQVAEIVVGDD